MPGHGPSNLPPHLPAGVFSTQPHARATRRKSRRGFSPALATVRKLNVLMLVQFCRPKVDRMKTEFCVACGSTDDLQHHHLVMRSEGGSEDEANLITLCTACHHKVHERQMHGSYNHGKLVKAAQAKARASGRRMGRRTWGDRHPMAVDLARRLRNERRSLRQIARELFAAGYCSTSGRQVPKSTISAMVDGHAPKVSQGCRPWLVRHSGF